MSCHALHIWLSLRVVHLCPCNACACGGIGRRRFPVIASSFTLDSSSLKTEHFSTFYGVTYRRWHSPYCSVLLVRFVPHKFVLQTLPLTVINPQTFSSNSGEEIKRVVKVTCVFLRLTSCGSHSSRLSIRATLCPRQFLQRLFFLRLENLSSTNIGAIVQKHLQFRMHHSHPFRFSLPSVKAPLVKISSAKTSSAKAATKTAIQTPQRLMHGVPGRQPKMPSSRSSGGSKSDLRWQMHLKCHVASKCSHRSFFLFPVGQSCQKAQTTSSSTLISSLLTGRRRR